MSLKLRDRVRLIAFPTGWPNYRYDLRLGDTGEVVQVLADGHVAVGFAHARLTLWLGPEQCQLVGRYSGINGQRL